MIPYPYNMVDMAGIDLAEANGTVVDGVYAKIVEAVNSCGDVVLYNWKFAGIEIAPQHTSILMGEDSLLINGLIQVTELDVVTVLGIDPPPPPILPVEPLTVSENGVYTAVPPASGFNPVTVDVQSGSAYVVSYYVNDDLVHQVPVLKLGSVPQYITVIDGSFWSYPAIASVESDMNVDMVPATPNFTFRQIYLTDYRIDYVGGSAIITPLSVSGIPSRYGVVISPNYELDLEFEATSANRQYGRCTTTATMPGILNYGSGRTWYSQYQNGVSTVITYTAGQEYFIEMDMTGSVTIENFLS